MPTAARTETPSSAIEPSLVQIPAAWFLMGSATGQDCERPIHRVWVDGFLLAATQVTNAEYEHFLRATSTQAPPFWSDPNFNNPQQAVTGVSWFEAARYCEWLSSQTARAYRLPTEAEWEFAARGGLEQERFPWGDELTPGGHHLCNVWQGDFPTRDLAEDGYAGTSPVKAFPPNGYGLYSVSGNTWEWCADWFHPSYHLVGSRKNPAGPSSGSTRVMKGGSYLCHESYCNRYRVAARTSNTPDSSTTNIGFRCVRDVATA